jgi:hypothetical protein
MLSAVAITAILGLAAAQTVDTTEPCSQQPVGFGPIPSPNTDTAFSAFTTFASVAIAAVAPSGWQRTFTNLNASELYDPPTMVYLGYQTMSTYDAGQCLALCDSTTGCVGANLYFERNPTLNPADACPNPTAQTLIKCALWGSLITPAAATNYGQYREQFHVVIAGSNAYMKLPALACSAISSAYNGNGYSWPTGKVNWLKYSSMPAATATAPSFKTVATAMRPVGPDGARRTGW